LKWPKETIFVTRSYEELADLNEILGMPVYIMDLPGPLDMFVAFPASDIAYKKLQKAFLEYMELFPMDVE
jgi:hypothetical protein